MIDTQIALIRRELLEHRSIYIVPAVLTLVIVLLEVTGHVSVAAFGQKVDIALLGATNIGEEQRGAFISLMMLVLSFFYMLEMLIIAAFYTLDSLYAERKDKSILFWRSLPVTDAETVISKLLTALIVIPAITLAFVVIAHILSLVVTSVWVSVRGASASHLIWAAAPLFDNWAATLIVVIAAMLWLSPFVGWGLLVSAYTKRSPMMMAVLPIVILPMLERIFLSSHLLADAIFMRFANMPLFDAPDFMAVINEDSFENVVGGLHLLPMINIGKFLGSSGLWGGLIVCALFTTAAIYVRRFRDES